MLLKVDYTQDLMVPWIKVAESEARRWKGLTEQYITQGINYHAEVGWGETYPGLVGDKQPWCASFANYCLKEAGFKMSKPEPTAVSFASDRNFVQIEKPTYGAIAVVGTKHVGFLYSIDARGNYILLGGNQADRVKFSPFLGSRLRFYLPRDYMYIESAAPPLETKTDKELNKAFGVKLDNVAQGPERIL